MEVIILASAETFHADAGGVTFFDVSILLYSLSKTLLTLQYISQEIIVVLM
jgi:hypothetical protein